MPDPRRAAAAFASRSGAAVIGAARFGAAVVGAALGAACVEPPAAAPPPAPWVYAPDVAAWPPAPVRGELGRGALVPPPEPAGVRAAAGVTDVAPFDVDALWPVPGDGPARAIVSGRAGDRVGVELVDIDAGVVRWREVARCGRSVIAVTATTVVCGDAQGASGLALADGRERWRAAGEFVGATGGLVLAVAPGQLIVRGADDGAELARAPFAPLDASDAPRVACRSGDGFDVYAWGQTTAVRRLAVARGATTVAAKDAWAIVIGAPIEIDPVGAQANDACDDVVLMTAAGPDGDEAVTAVDRARGAVRGGPLVVAAHWPARGGAAGEVELALSPRSGKRGAGAGAGAGGGGAGGGAGAAAAPAKPGARAAIPGAKPGAGAAIPGAKPGAGAAIPGAKPGAGAAIPGAKPGAGAAIPGARPGAKPGAAIAPGRPVPSVGAGASPATATATATGAAATTDDAALALAPRGLERRDRALGAPTRVSDRVVAGLVASRGDRRLVRTPDGALILLGADAAADDDAPILSAPAGVGRAVLGDRFVLSGPWRGVRTEGDPLRRYPLPAAPAAPAPAALTTSTTPTSIDPPDLFDHPDLPTPVTADDRAAVALADAGGYQVAGVAVDPGEPARVYALPLEDALDATHGAGLAAFDLRARAWAWRRADGCPPGGLVGLAVAPAADVVVCGARGNAPGHGELRASGRADGAPRWTWKAPQLDAVEADGDVVLAIAASTVVVLDARSGAELDRFGADDGGLPRAIVVAARGTTFVIAAERGAIVARVPALGMLPRWAVRVRGAVASLARAGDRVAVGLADGELYLVDPATGAATAAGGWSDAWRAPGGGDLVLVQARDAERREWRLAGFGPDGVRRFRVALTLDPPWQLGAARARVAGAPLALAWGPALRAAAVLDARRGALQRLVALPARAVPGLVFSTYVDGAAVTGAVLSHPLAIVTF